MRAAIALFLNYVTTGIDWLEFLALGLVALALAGILVSIYLYMARSGRWGQGALTAIIVVGSCAVAGVGR